MRAVGACGTLSFPADEARVGKQRCGVAEAADTKGALHAYWHPRLGYWRCDCTRQQLKPCVPSTGCQIFVLGIISRNFIESEELVIHLNSSVQPLEHNVYRHHNSHCRYRNRTELCQQGFSKQRMEALYHGLDQARGCSKICCPF